MLTVTLSWTVINTVYTLHYASSLRVHDQRHRVRRLCRAEPDYRDFAYVAFTIGMTYQVSDTTVTDRRIRRGVLAHALWPTCSVW